MARKRIRHGHASDTAFRQVSCSEELRWRANASDTVTHIRCTLPDTGARFGRRLFPQYFCFRNRSTGGIARPLNSPEEKAGAQCTEQQKSASATARKACEGVPPCHTAHPHNQIQPSGRWPALRNSGGTQTNQARPFIRRYSLPAGGLL